MTTQLLLRPPPPIIPSQLSVCPRNEAAAALTTSSSSSSCVPSFPPLRLTLGRSRRRRRRRSSRGASLRFPSSEYSSSSSSAAAAAAEAEAEAEAEASIDDDDDEMDDMKMMRVLSGEEKQKKLSGRERRALRNQNRKGWNWKDEVEEGDFRYTTTTTSKNMNTNRNRNRNRRREKSSEDRFNLNALSKLGPQWWTLNVNTQLRDTAAKHLINSFNNSFPKVPLKVYNPAIKVRRRLKNGSISTRAKAVYANLLFIHCVLNKEIHDFIRRSYGIGGFIGSRIKIPNNMEVTKPKPVPDMETVFKEEKKQQEIADRAFEEQYSSEESSDADIQSDSPENTKSAQSRTKRKQTRKKSVSSSINPMGNESDGPLLLGADVRVLSGPFAGFTGRLEELNHRSGKALVVFMLFGSEVYHEFEVDHIVAEASP